MSSSRYIMVFEAIGRILETQGIENLTITNIAKQCHLHPSTVNYYFNGKSDMFMRFYTYITNKSHKSLPGYYFEAPDTAEEAVKAFASIIDLELFRPDHMPLAQIKLHQYMLGTFDYKPEIRHYLVGQENAHQDFVRQTVMRYLDAGILEPGELEEGISTIALISMGHMHLRYYYNRPIEEAGMLQHRYRILRLMIRERYHRLVERYVQ